MNLSHSLKLSCPVDIYTEIGAKRMVLILSKRAPSPRGLVYGTSLPVLSKTVQSKLQQRSSREAGLWETFRKTTRGKYNHSYRLPRGRGV